MASFDGVSKDKAEEILGMSVVSGMINGSGHLILTRQNGSTIDAGDFTGIVEDVFADTVTAAVATAVPNYVAGTVIDKGTISGAYVPSADLNSTTAVNALIKATINGNISIAASDMPSAPKPNTQWAMRIIQDATGGRTVTFTGIKKSQGVLQLTPTANAIDILMFFYDGATWYVGMMGADLK